MIQWIWETRDTIQIQTIQKLLESSEIMGLEVNRQKTEYVRVCIANRNRRIQVYQLLCVHLRKYIRSFKYLGANTNNAHEEIKDRLAILVDATKVYTCCGGVCLNPNVFHEDHYNNPICRLNASPILTYMDVKHGRLRNKAAKVLNRIRGKRF